MTVRIAALAAAVLLVLVALFQAALAFGLPWGGAAYGGGAAGADGVLPTGLRISSAVAAVVLTLAAWVVLRRGGVLTAGRPSDRIALVDVGDRRVPGSEHARQSVILEHGRTLGPRCDHAGSRDPLRLRCARWATSRDIAGDTLT